MIRIGCGQYAHGVDLARRGVGAQDDVRGRRVERVLHVARRVMRRDVQQLKVELVGLHLARAIDLEAHQAEDAIDVAQRLRDQVQASGPGRASGQRHVDARAAQRTGQRALLQRRECCLVRRLQRAFQLVRPLAHGRALLARQRPDGAEQVRERALAAQHRRVPRVQRREVVGLVQLLQRFCVQRLSIELVMVIHLKNKTPPVPHLGRERAPVVPPTFPRKPVPITTPSCCVRAAFAKTLDAP